MTAETLWNCIVAAYGVPGVAPLCLRLQDEGDIDVLLLLALCQVPLAPAEVEALAATLAPWRAAAVLPVRRLRRALRAPVAPVPEAQREGFRNQVKALELAAERLQAGLIADWLAARGPQAPADPEAGLRHLLRGVAISEAELALLRRA